MPILTTTPAAVHAALNALSDHTGFLVANPIIAAAAAAPPYVAVTRLSF